MTTDLSEQQCVIIGHEISVNDLVVSIDGRIGFVVKGCHAIHEEVHNPAI